MLCTELCTIRFLLVALWCDMSGFSFVALGLCHFGLALLLKESLPHGLPHVGFRLGVFGKLLVGLGPCLPG